MKEIKCWTDYREITSIDPDTAFAQKMYKEYIFKNISSFLFLEFILNHEKLMALLLSFF